MPSLQARDRVSLTNKTMARLVLCVFLYFSLLESQPDDNSRSDSPLNFNNESLTRLCCGCKVGYRKVLNSLHIILCLSSRFFFGITCPPSSRSVSLVTYASIFVLLFMYLETYFVKILLRTKMMNWENKLMVQHLKQNYRTSLVPLRIREVPDSNIRPETFVVFPVPPFNRRSNNLN
jgi:hypothetical protein